MYIRYSQAVSELLQGRLQFYLTAAWVVGAIYPMNRHNGRYLSMGRYDIQDHRRA